MCAYLHVCMSVWFLRTMTVVIYVDGTFSSQVDCDRPLQFCLCVPITVPGQVYFLIWNIFYSIFQTHAIYMVFVHAAALAHESIPAWHCPCGGSLNMFEFVHSVVFACCSPGLNRHRHYALHACCCPASHGMLLPLRAIYMNMISRFTCMLLPLRAIQESPSWWVLFAFSHGLHSD